MQESAEYLRDLLRMFNFDLHLTIAEYNAGEQAVMKYGNHILPYRETLAYVPKVMKFYKRLQHRLCFSGEIRLQALGHGIAEEGQSNQDFPDVYRQRSLFGAPSHTEAALRAPTPSADYLTPTATGLICDLKPRTRASLMSKLTR